MALSVHCRLLYVKIPVRSQTSYCEFCGGQSSIGTGFLQVLQFSTVSIITVARDLNETDTSRKTGRMLIWGSHRPLHGVANVTSLVANEETRFKVLTLKHLLECSKVNRQPTGKRETKFKEQKEIRMGGSYRVRTPRISSRLDWVK
jgi:hypothetical protein